MNEKAKLSRTDENAQRGFRWIFVILAGVTCTSVTWPSVTNAQLAFEREPIRYSTSTATDRVARLIQDLDSQATRLSATEGFGYLPSLLRELEIAVSSQTLVFSRTSLQRQHISPKTPRAIYFNDDTYVGWVPDGEVIEIAAVDPQLGTVFYVLKQPDQEAKPASEFERPKRQNHECLFCHANSDTGRVPGLLMLSVYCDDKGHRVFPAEAPATNPSGPLLGRWGGWYATGDHGGNGHLGNRTVESETRVLSHELSKAALLSNLDQQFDTSRYLSPHSDLVALLVLRDQVNFHNLLTQANHQARRIEFDVQMQDAADVGVGLTTEVLGQRRSKRHREASNEVRQIAEQLAAAVLMTERLQIDAPVRGSSMFAKEFAATRGPDDRLSRLRQLDLNTTLFLHSCHHLIGSESFRQLPARLREIASELITDRLRATQSSEAVLDLLTQEGIL